MLRSFATFNILSEISVCLVKNNVNFFMDNIDDLWLFNEKLKEDEQYKTDFLSQSITVWKKYNSYFDSAFQELALASVYMKEDKLTRNLTAALKKIVSGNVIMNFTSVKATAGKITLRVRMVTLYNAIYSKFRFHIHLKDIVRDFTGNILFQIVSRKESEKKEINLSTKPLTERLEFASVGPKIGMVIDEIATLINVYNRQETMI